MMRFCLCLLPLAVVTPAVAAPPPVSVEDLRALLKNPNGDLSEVAKTMAGSKGGNRLFYFPTRDEPSTPSAWGLKYESVDFKSADGTSLHGWLIPGKGKSIREAKGTVVFSHGNAGSISYHLCFCTWLAEAGYNVLVYDYRGFGKSGGSVDRRGMIDDVKAAFTYAMRREDIDGTRLISYGHSLGGSQSITALAEAPVKGLRAIVTDAAFASYQAMARVVAGDLGASLVDDELAPEDYIARLPAVPLLLIHGTADEVVPISQGRALFKAAHEPKTLFEVKAARHGSALSNDDGAYRGKMLAWLDERLRG